MWQWALHSSLDQSLPNRSPISRRDRIADTNISPWDPLLWWGKRRKARDKGKEEERGTEGKRERDRRVSERKRERENGRFLGETRSLRRAGFKSSLSPVSSWLWGQWFLSSSRSSGRVQSTGWETLMIWQLHRGGENALLLGDAPVHFYCSLVAPSGVLEEHMRGYNLVHSLHIISLWRILWW